MAQTTARIKRNGKNFEILVDEDIALKVKKGEEGVSAAVLTDSIFYNLKSGEHASLEDLETIFETTDMLDVAEKIIKNGEIVRTSASLSEDQEKKYKQVVDFLHKNAS